MVEEFTFDPKSLIGAPFRKCEKCGKANEGLLSVYPRRYTRRCQDCWNTYHKPLPLLKKSVLYLDQFAVSETMKSINPETKANQAGRVDPYWKELFGRLERSCKLQLLVCPTSEFHWSESIVATEEPALRRIYEHFSGDVSFRDIDQIQFVQVEADVKAWLTDPAAPAPLLDPASAVEGELGGWWSTLNVSMAYRPEQLEKIGDIVRTERDNVHDQVAKLFAHWQSSKPSFEDQLGQEYILIEKSKSALVRASLGRAGVPEGKLDELLQGYMKTGRMRNLPCFCLISRLNASVARRAASGQTTPPDRGAMNDLQMVAYLLPYCDAIILDRRCHAYLRDEPLKSELARFPCRIFSAENKADLLTFLDAVLASAPDEHVKQVREVYGDDWDKPYDNMFAYL